MMMMFTSLVWYYTLMQLNMNSLGRKVGGTRVVPIVAKIVGLFAVFILMSNLASNYINLALNQGELLKLANRLLIKDLKELYSTAANQYAIFEFSRDAGDAIASLEESSTKNLQGQRSAAFGVRADGSLLFWASASGRPERFSDDEALRSMVADHSIGTDEGKLRFVLGGSRYFSIYKYNEKWDAFLIRAEEETEFYAESRSIFMRVSLIILAMTLVCLVIGIVLIRRILRFVTRFTDDLMRMQSDQNLSLIDLTGAPNDDITYLGASFNTLSSTINNLLRIFKRFVTQDIAQKAYIEHSIKLEGTTRELTILFTDIKGFTYMTETLGNDIIDVLNLHYDRAIKHIHEQDGIVGSIIGDALLAIFGTMPNGRNKSAEALEAAVRIQEVAATLRQAMLEKSERLITEHGDLSTLEKKVLKAVLVEVGVGLDGGEVFYGNIGSYERMTNTVIGDNVNSSSRLEGLTRIYGVPIICSEFVKNEATGTGFRFVELDLVQVKGKMEGKRIFWPIPLTSIDAAMAASLDSYEAGLPPYYAGDWDAARLAWKDCGLPMMEEFNRRLDGDKPSAWNGIWAMRTK